MTSKTIKKNGRTARDEAERSEAQLRAAARPDPEVLAKARRRQFSADYKLRVLEEADACEEPGSMGTLLRREGLYSSHLTVWRRARREGALGALKKQRGPRGLRQDPVALECELLRKENARLKHRLHQAETILEIQKKASEILGIPLSRLESGEYE
jgi:transposase-like protein